MIGPSRNAKFKGGIMRSRADMMSDGGGDGDGRDGADDHYDGGDGNGDGYEACVPIQSIAVDGTPPGVGDTVNFSIEGTVTDIKGDMAYVDIDSVDGEAVESYGAGGAQGGQAGNTGSTLGSGGQY